MLDKKQIVARIASHGKTAKKLREEIQVTLCEIAGHVVQHGEVSLYQALLNAVQGTNRVGIHKWIAENGGARFANEKWEINKDWLKEHRNGAKTPEDCKAARVAFEEYHAEQQHPLPLWYEEAQPQEDADVAKVWDAFEKAEEFILNIAKKAKSSKVEAKHTDLERYLREAMEKYKAECLVSPDKE